MTTRHAKQYRQYIRQAAGVPHWLRGVEVRLAEGSDDPTLRKFCGGWYTRGGTPVRHHSAYARKGWSNLVYKAAEDRTHVQVSAGWLAAHHIPAEALVVGL